jgi:hypothetical protein
MKLLSLALPATLSVTLFAGLAAAQITSGSPTTNRPIDDSATGLICIYRGGTQPVVGPAQLARWSFFDNEFAGSSSRVTPLLLKANGVDSWVVVGIGTTRQSNSGGVQSHSFATLTGTAALLPGQTYTVGFTNRGYTLNGAALVPDGGNGGVIDFDGYSDFSDRWSYATGTAQVGTVLGGSGLPLDSFGLNGRIYSARFELDSVLSLPGCFQNPAQLTANVQNLEPGTQFTAKIQASGFSAGLWQLYLGAPGISSTSCGFFLPGFGELLLLPGSQVSLGSGNLAAGQGQLSLTVPNNPALVGQDFLLQGLAAGIFTPGFPLELSNGVAAQILP